MLLDFFVARARATAERAPLVPVDVSFGDAVQVFNIGAASCGAYGAPAGVHAASERYGTIPLAELSRPRGVAGARRRRGQRPSRPTCSRSSRRSPSTRRRRAGCSCPRGARMRSGRSIATRRSPTRSSCSAREGPAPFYAGEVAAAVVRLGARARRHAHAARIWPPTRPSPREPVRVAYRGREVLTNPPPSAGGTCWPTRSRCWSDRPARRTRSLVARAMERAQSERTPAFLDGLAEPGFLRSLHGEPARLHHAHLGDGRRRLGVRGHVHQRRGVGHRRASAPASTSTT